MAGRLNVRKLFRYGLVGLSIFLAILTTAILLTVTVDLGPVLRARAERAGSAFTKRPVHIGRLSARLFRGQFLVEDLVIEGLTPADRPFLRAKRIAVSMSLGALFRNREVLFDSIQMTDWQIHVETFSNGRHTFPNFTRDRSGPRRFTTTVRLVRASRGQFTYEDHGMPWSTVARNLDVTVRKAPDYRGEASFSGGTVAIQRYVPMRADMRCTFAIDGSTLRLDRIDLETDGARSLLRGVVDMARWPEQLYQVRSRVQLPRMREIFFARETFSLYGDSDFTGTFHLFKGGRELKGSFASEIAGVNAYRFPALRGSLVWEPSRFEVLEATSRFLGGDARFRYALAPLGRPTPAVARFDAAYENVDLAAFTDFLQTKGLRLAGRASGRNRLEWPLGRFADHRGEGHLIVQPPEGTEVLGRALAEGSAPAEESVNASRLTTENTEVTEKIWPEHSVVSVVNPARAAGPGRAAPRPLSGYLPVGGELEYTFGPEWIDLERGRFATPTTFVEFEGRTAYGERSRIPFHVTSADWQESDRVLAAVMTAFGAPTRPVAVGGRGEFDGVMLNAFRKPRVEGSFVGEDLRAWDVVWGSGRGTVAIENGYLDVTGGVLRRGQSEIHAEGRFALGYPRRDGGEELNARVRVGSRPLVDLRHAFDLDDYLVDGRFSGEFHLYGQYEHPFGFGRMTIEEGAAYREPFRLATADLRFEGAGVRLDRVDIQKDRGSITGAAYVGWDGTYSFNADGRRLPLESVAAVSYPRAPLSGVLEFSANGSGTFEAPRYDVRAGISDVFVIDEGIGHVTGRLGVRGDLLTLEVNVASPRLAVSGSGRVDLSSDARAELSFRFTDTSLDPYVRVFEPRLSPFTTAVASGAIRVTGPLTDIDRLLVEGDVDRLDLKLFDYRLRNAAPIRLALDRHTVRVDRMRLVGQDTQLDISGAVALHDNRIAVRVVGDANLGILQGFFRNLRSAGRAELVGDIQGPLGVPVFSGLASITGGRIRHFSLPHAVEAINGRVTLDAEGLHFGDLVARVGGGEVRFGGRVGFNGYLPGELNITAVGTEMRVRYPEGFRSVIDADLALRGLFKTPTLEGTVTVKDGVWTKRFDLDGGLFDLTGGGTPGAPAPPAEVTLPLTFDIRILAPSTLRIQNNTARIVSSADLSLRGTYDRPLLFGRAQVERGEVLFEGRRYLVTQGSIDFANPTRIEPFFDVEAETRVRAPGQTYRVVLRASGTVQLQRLNLEFSSDPPLPVVDILSLLLGDVRGTEDVELRRLRSPNRTEDELIRARVARMLASPISSEVGRAVEQTFGLDAFQITPSLIDPSQQSSRLTPGARLTIGKRISDRAYLTFSRSLTSSSRDEIILIEYDQSDRLSWILSRNEDFTYALDVRVRHTF